jgi:acyl transferase domain-containing protein/acyl carrier protein
MTDFSERIAKLSPKRLALLALELQKRLDSYEHLRPEPIAVIGMGCRFPGGADSPATFWRLLHEGRDASRETPPERWDADALHDADPATPGKMYTRHGSFLDNIDRFDAGFFGISPREAVSLDPQQRLLLEVAWEAIEDAGIAADRLMGTSAGVFVGACHMDYLELFEDFRLIDAYVATGSSLSLAAGRLSYVLGVQGPALTVDTACSSSLVALHLACQSLRAGECKLALAGGTNLVVTPKTTVALCELRALSPDGRCKTFDASADGYGRGEGCGVVVLKRLSDATKDGDRILAIVRGTAVNQDGRSGGLTAPNGPAQEAVLRQALTAADVEPKAVGYVEAHGTGTSLGDPIEVQALTAVYGKDRPADRPLLIGSVKTNFGHLEAAAGMAGLLKVILSLQQHEVPPHLHLKTPNPYIPWNELPVRVPVSPTPWPDGPRLAAISSFGFSGTNAHAVIEEPPAVGTGEPPDLPQLLPLSARSAEALREQARRFAVHLAANLSLSLADICHTAGVGRVHFNHRLAVAGTTTPAVRESLAAFAAGQSPAGVQTGQVERDRPARIAFLFTGQGAQYAGMAKALYESSPTFREALDRCTSLLQPHLDRPLLEIIHPQDGVSTTLDQTAHTQPALFAVEYALAVLWQSWGVHPDALLGHSLGEYVAACVGGVLDLEDALKLVAVRSQLMQAQPAGGGMAAVFTDENRVSEALRPFADRLSIAALNGPGIVVVTGQQQALDEVLGRLEREGVRAERLRVSHAFHSPLMEPVLDPFRRAAESVTHAVPRIPIASNLSGNLEQGAIFSADYWCNHLRQPVRFDAGMQALRAAGIDVLIEIGPAPVLLGMGRRCLPDHAGLWLPSLRRGRGDWEQLLESLGSLYTRGIDIDWIGFNADAPRRRVSLPTYPFERERYWVESAPSWNRNGESEGPVAGERGHPALGRRLRSPLRDVQFESGLSVSRRPALADHRVYDTVVVPASWHVSMLLTAAVENAGQSHQLKDVAFPEAIVLPAKESRTVQVILSPGQNGSTNAQVLSLRPGDGQEWTVHATATLLIETNVPARRDLEPMRQRCPGERDVVGFYQMIWDGGIQLDSRFRWVEHLQVGESEAVCRMRGPRSGDDEAYALPPGLIDSCFQLVAATIPGAGADATAYVPFGIDGVVFTGRARGTLWAYAVLRPSGASGQELHTANVVLFEENGRVVVAFEGLHLKRARRDALLRSGQQEQDTEVYEVAWQPLESTSPSESPSGPWLIIGTNSFAGALVESLRQKGESVHVAPAGEALPRGVRSVVFLGGLDASKPEECQTVCAQALSLIQSILHSGMTPFPRLILVTRGAQVVGQQSAVQPAQAPLWGLGRTVRLEHPDASCVCVDLDPGSEPAAESLLTALATLGREDQVVLRGVETFVARLDRRPTAKNEPFPIRDDVRYLITGGLGGLGLLVARWLVERGARQLILVGRRVPSEEATQTIRDLEQAGATITVAQIDVADPEQVARLLREAANPLIPVRGIIHAAGILDNAVLVEQDEQMLARVFAPKVAGAWNLHTATREMPLDFFVLFSSVAAVLGSPGQANYAAANAFLDTLAHERRLQGLPGLSINWGPWGETGMAARVDERQKQRWEAQGVEGIAPAAGLAILGRLLADAPTQATVLRVRWPRFLAQFPTNDAPPILSTLQLRQTRTTGPAPASDLLKLLEQTPESERADFLLRHVMEEATRVLRLGAGQTLDPRQPLNEMGMDSLMAVELRNRLGAAVGRTLSATLLFNYPTIEKLSRYLSGELAGVGKVAAVAKPQAAADEPIAIIGIGCRLPGAGNPDEYWRMLRDGVDAVKEVPADRWDVDAYYDADPDAPGKMYTRRGGFIDSVDGFDAGFFGIAPREAVNMDPQQRLLLEVAWEALEDAAIAPERISSTLTAVYVGISTSDYSQLMLKNNGLDGINAYTGTGNAFSVAAGRVSYVLGLQGPNFPVDTACSSSLLAVHLACQSLRTGESSLALACGVNLILTPEGHIYFCKLRATSPDGKCKTFDASANGYVRGEGCGVVVLKRLSDAQRDGDRIQAVIRGTAVNHDGRSNGLTAPNGAAQEAVIRQALVSGGLKPEEVGYIEAHGTGTPLGDPIELQALAAVLGQRREPLLVGSVKTNIGHLEAGAGVASLIKVVLALRENTIPPHLHFLNPNPLVPWNELPIRIVSERMPWLAGEQKRRAGVSSFGFSGTNVHVIVEEAPTVATGGSAVLPQFIPLSARSETALRQLAESWAQHLEQHSELALADVAFTARVGRTTLAHRLALVASSVQEAREKLTALANGRTVEEIWSGVATNNVLGNSFSPGPFPEEAEQQRIFLEELARRFVQGEVNDWQKLESVLPRGHKVALPTYPFERQRYWIETKDSESWRDWLHELRWEPSPLAASQNASITSRWLIFSDEDCGPALARSLEERGAVALKVSTTVAASGPLVVSSNKEASKRAACGYEQERHWSIDPTNTEHFRRLVAEVRTGGELAGIVFLWGLQDAGDIDRCQQLGCGAVLNLVQALLSSGQPARLWLVTRNAQSGDSVPFQAPLWGLGRVLALEHPELSCVRIDLDNAGVIDQVEPLVEELTATDGEDQIALRGGKRHAARLAPCERSLPAKGITCEEEASYLITGGTGALGLQLARWLSSRGARHVALLSRRGAAALDEAARKELDALPAKVRIYQGDVASADDVRRVFDEIEREMPPVRGIIHAAGVLDDGVILQQDWPRFERVLAPKLRGAWNLHQQTKDRPLDFFVLFSSVASLLGSPGQANYAAANAGLDALAHHRRSLGLPALSINWGQWAGEGMASGVGERIEAQGLRRIDPARGLEVLGRLMASDAVQVGVLPVDWNEFFRKAGSEAPIFRTLAQGRSPEAKSETVSLARQLGETPAAERQGRLRDFVAGQVRRVMGQAGPDEVPGDRPLMDLGMDSLMAVELRNVLGRATRTELSTTLLFDHPTVNALAGHLAVAAFADLFPQGDLPEDGERTKLLDEVEQLSQDEMESLIAQEFSRLKKS